MSLPAACEPQAASCCPSAVPLQTNLPASLLAASLAPGSVEATRQPAEEVAQACRSTAQQLHARGAGDEGAAIAPRAWEAPELLREGAGGAAKPRSHPTAKLEPGPSARVPSEAFCAALGGRATAAPNFEEP